MHVRELVELGALVATHGSTFLQHSSVLSQRHMEQYWLASRCRHDRWFQALRGYEQTDQLGKLKQWPYVQAIIEEVLVGELLTRTWTAVGCSFDKQHETSHFEPIVRNVLAGHTEARNRSLHTLLNGQGFAVEEGVRLNRLRRQTERWTDMMLGHLASEIDIEEFAFEPDLARDFAADLCDEKRSATDETAWKITLTSLRAAYHNALSDPSPHAELNQRIAASVLACFHCDLFNSIGRFESHWTLRLDQVADDTQGLVEDLILLEEAVESHADDRR